MERPRRNFFNDAFLITTHVKALCSQVFQDFPKTSPLHSVVDKSIRAPSEKNVDLARAKNESSCHSFGSLQTVNLKNLKKSKDLYLALCGDHMTL